MRQVKGSGLSCTLELHETVEILCVCVTRSYSEEASSATRANAACASDAVVVIALVVSTAAAAATANCCNQARPACNRD